MRERTEASREVTRTLTAMGFPTDFAELVGGELNTDFTAVWMLRYLAAARPKTMEEVADEMLDILVFRERYIQQKIARG